MAKPTMLVVLTALAFTAGVAVSQFWLAPPAAVAERTVLTAAPVPGPAAPAETRVSRAPESPTPGPATAQKPVDAAPAPSSAPAPAPAPAPAVTASSPPAPPAGQGTGPKVKLLNPEWQEAARTAPKQEKARTAETSEAPKQPRSKVAASGPTRRERLKLEAEQPEFRSFSPPPFHRQSPEGYAAMREFMLGR